MPAFVIILFIILVHLNSEETSHTQFGIPKGNIVLYRNEFIYSVNTKTGFADWVLYKVSNDDFGNAPRWNREFFKDSLIDLKIKMPTNSDYENSGYDRGHLVRSEERTVNSEANRNTFVLTNVVPQTKDLNRGPWFDLERWVETACKDSLYTIWIISGPIFDKSYSRLANKFLIPKFYFKVLLIKTPDNKFRKLAVLMPNITGIRNRKWERFIVPIDVIEKATKLKFFDAYK